MLDRFIIIAFLLVVTLGTILVSFPDGAAAILVVLILTGIGLTIFRGFTEEKDFVSKLFLMALAVRLAFGIMVHVFDLRNFFGGDAVTYDHAGGVIVDNWLGRVNPTSYEVFRATTTTRPGWGMNYLVGFLYLLLGKNIFAAQSFCAVIGAATAPMVYFCADRIFANRRVARIAAIAVGFFPAMIIWSAQLLKDGLIVFLLVLAMTMVIQLQKRVNLIGIALLTFSMLGILSLRFYIFYMLAIAVLGSFVVGVSRSNKSVLARISVLIVIGFGLTYFGVLRFASADLDRYGDLKKVQNSRQDLAERADSGFGSDADVSTAVGAISVVPLGFVVLMFAPFPWQFGSLRQAVAVPETVLWWALMPVMFTGILFTLKNKLRNAMPVLLFSLMLTIAYSIFQGNVGTAYRQRTQIQVFLFMFAAVGLVIRSEKRADRMMLNELERERADARLAKIAEERARN